MELDLLIKLTVDIVSSHVGSSSIQHGEIPELIRNTFDALERLAVKTEEPVVEKKPPAVPIKRSVTPDFLICLEDGRRFKSLKRHLRSVYNLTPDEYRSKWNLPSDYPMVAPNYAIVRSALAKQAGLGVGGRSSAKGQ